MSEPAPEAPQAPESQPEPQKPDTGEKDWQAEAEKWKALARKHEGSAKANADAAKRLAEIEEANKTDLEKAVDAARKEGTSEALRSLAPRLVAAEFRIAAAGRLTTEQVSELIEDLDLSKYLTEDGEVDTKRVAKKVEALAPAQSRTPPSFGGGPRASAPVTDMNQLIRRAAGRG